MKVLLIIAIIVAVVIIFAWGYSRGEIINSIAINPFPEDKYVPVPEGTRVVPKEVTKTIILRKNGTPNDAAPAKLVIKIGKTYLSEQHGYFPTYMLEDEDKLIRYGIDTGDFNLSGNYKDAFDFANIKPDLINSILGKTGGHLVKIYTKEVAVIAESENETNDSEWAGF